MPSHLQGENQVLYGALLAAKTKVRSMNVVATAEMAIGAEWPTLLLMDPGGAARTVLLPPEADCVDQIFIIVNIADAAETITVEEDSSTTSIGTVAQNTSGMFHCDGTTWRKVVL